MRTKLVLTKQSLMWGLAGVWKVDLHVNPHEYIRGEPAKLLTLFHPKTGRVVGKGVKKCSNAVLHPWLKEQLDEIIKNLLAESKNESDEERRQSWGLRCSGTINALKLFLPHDFVDSTQGQRWKTHGHTTLRGLEFLQPARNSSVICFGFLAVNFQFGGKLT